MHGAHACCPRRSATPAAKPGPGCRALQRPAAGAAWASQPGPTAARARSPRGASCPCAAPHTCQIQPAQARQRRERCERVARQVVVVDRQRGELRGGGEDGGKRQPRAAALRRRPGAGPAAASVHEGRALLGAPARPTCVSPLKPSRLFRPRLQVAGRQSRAGGWGQWVPAPAAVCRRLVRTIATALPTSSPSTLWQRRSAQHSAAQRTWPAKASPGLCTPPGPAGTRGPAPVAQCAVSMPARRARAHAAAAPCKWQQARQQARQPPSGGGIGTPGALQAGPSAPPQQPGSAPCRC